MRRSNADVITGKLHRHYNERSSDDVYDVFAENYVDHDAPVGGAHGPDETKRLVEMVLALGDTSVEIHQTVSEGEFVACRYTLTIRYRDDFEGPLAGTTSTVNVIEMNRLENGKVVEAWGQTDADRAPVLD
jgi:predicted ester cyclase